MMKDAAKTASWLDLANPTCFLAFAGRVVPWLGLASAIFLAVGLYMVFLSPDDYQQGSTVRIMYIHVPFAWLSMMCYSIMAVSSLGTLVWRHPLADVSVRAAAPIGAVFTALALATGSLWGKPMWGTWWVWDARLTSVFVLFLMYLGIIALSRAMDDPARSAKPVAVLTLVGFINVPIIKFSGRLVEYAASACFRISSRRPNHRRLHAAPAFRDGYRLHAFVLHAAYDGDA